MNRRFLDLAQGRGFGELPSSLANVLDRGYVINDGGFLIRALAECDTNAKSRDFPDQTGYECFINHLHIDEYTDSNPIGCALHFAYAVLSSQHDFEVNLRPIVAIIGIQGDQEVEVRFHRERVGEDWLAGNLESYREGVLALSNTNRDFLRTL